MATSEPAPTRTVPPPPWRPYQRPAASLPHIRQTHLASTVALIDEPNELPDFEAIPALRVLPRCRRSSERVRNRGRMASDRLSVDGVIPI
jgi:hypothetical protein